MEISASLQVTDGESVRSESAGWLNFIGVSISFISMKSHKIIEIYLAKANAIVI